MSVTVAAPMVRMRIAATKRGLEDQNKRTWLWSGAAVGLVLAAGTVWAGFRGPDLVAVVVAVWMLGWIAGPLFVGGGDETLRPEFFTALPLRPRELAGGLLAASFAGVAPLVSLVALLALLVLGIRISLLAAIVAIPAIVLQLMVFVLASRLAVAAYGVLLRRRSGAVLAAVVNAFILAFSAQGWALIAAYVSSDVQGVLARGARIAPSGWGLVAVESAGSHDWIELLLALAGLAGLGVVMFVAWAALLVRRTTADRGGVRPRRPLVAHDAKGAAVGKELRSWSRDLLAQHRLVFSFAYGVFFCLFPLAVGWTGMLPWAGPIVLVMAGAMAVNLYAADGTALWLTVTTPGAAAVDVRARQRALLLVLGPTAVVLTVLLTAVSGHSSSWPLVLSVLPALLGAAAGLAVYFSVVAAMPMTDPQNRPGNPLQAGGDDGQQVGMVYAGLIGVGLLAAPALLAAIFGSWLGLVAGLATGWLYWWGFGRLAVTALERRGPELLSLLRFGRAPAAASVPGSQARYDELPPRTRRLVAICLGFGAIPLIPQGILPLIFKLNDTDARSWFLAMYTPDPWAYLVIAAMIGLGATMYGYGGYQMLRKKT